jgi:hypothetical protein
MKTFEKPVVVLNEMLMNESIAAACCYSLVNGLKEVKSGGKIDEKFITYSIPSKLLSYFGNVPPMVGTHEYVTITGIDANNKVREKTFPVLRAPSSGNVVMWTGSAVVTLNSGEDWFDKAGTSDATCFATSSTVDSAHDVWTDYASGHCDHGTKNCPYVEVADPIVAHLGATAPHLFAGPDWNTVHTAVQYQS